MEIDLNLEHLPPLPRRRDFRIGAIGAGFIMRDIHLVAYPDRVLKGRIGNILPIIDPNIRTAKVRLEVDNPGLMRLGSNAYMVANETAAQKEEDRGHGPRLTPHRVCAHRVALWSTHIEP